MIPMLEILFMPGAFIGLWLLRIICKLGLNLQNMCVFDHGSATSTGEHIFVGIGNIVFYGIILFAAATYIRKKINKIIIYEK